MIWSNHIYLSTNVTTIIYCFCNTERGEELKGSIDIKTPFAAYEKLSTEVSLEFESPTEFDFKV